MSHAADLHRRTKQNRARGTGPVLHRRTKQNQARGTGPVLHRRTKQNQARGTGPVLHRRTKQNGSDARGTGYRRPVSTSPPAAWLSWSSGKDCAWALHVMRSAGSPLGEVTVTGLLTTVNAAADRVAMHGVRRDLLQAQAAAVGLPLHVVELPWPCPNETYAELMGAATARAAGEGVTRIAFGDLYLADIRAYREAQLAGSGIDPVFPLWGLDTAVLAHDMLAAGLRAVTVCTDPARVPDSMAGRPFDAAFLADLPDGVDPCGENGEFHTFVTEAPGFASPVPVTVGDVARRDGFCYADLRPAG